MLAMGLDPGMGILHSDLKSRDSFVFDVIEPLRPVVDGWVLTLLAERTFAARVFFETRQGVCRLIPPLPQALAEMCPAWQRWLARSSSRWRRATAQGTAAKPLRVPTLLTQSNRRAGRDRVRTAPKRQRRSEKLEAPTACRSCGVLLEDAVRQYCDDCRSEV